MSLRNKTLELYLKKVELLDSISKKVDSSREEIGCLRQAFNHLLKKYGYDEVSLKKPVAYADKKLVFMHGKPGKKNLEGIGLAYIDDKYYLAGQLDGVLILGEIEWSICTGKEYFVNQILKNAKMKAIFNTKMEEALQRLGVNASREELSQAAVNGLFSNEEFLEYYEDWRKANPKIKDDTELYKKNSVIAKRESWEQELAKGPFNKKSKEILAMLGYFLI